MFSVRFWGVRGSMPCPGPDTVRFGGNTSCLEIRADNRLIIVDMGTGIRPLGEFLMANNCTKAPLDVDVFITHTHWDHIMGFPMFLPIFEPGHQLRIRGPVSFENDTLESIVSGQLSYRYWPVRASELSAHITYEELKETSLNLGGGLSVTTKYLNHSILCLGYRFEYEGKSIVTAYDHEVFRNLFPTDPADPNYNEEAAQEGEIASVEENEKLVRFLSGANLLIRDAQYTETEYGQHMGWGHSSYEQAIADAEKSGVKKMVFFHHDPSRTDAQLEQFEAEYRGKTPVETVMAKERMRLEA